MKESIIIIEIKNRKSLLFISLKQFDSNSDFVFFSNSIFSMGLTSEYLKFHPVGVFGLVTSSRCPPVYLSSRLVACGCNENVLVWNIATGLRSALLRGESSQGKDCLYVVSGATIDSNPFYC